MNTFLESHILPSQLNQSAQFKEYEAKCAEKALQYLSQPTSFEDDQQQNSDNLIEQQLKPRELIAQSGQTQKIDNFLDQIRSSVQTGSRKMSINSISDGNSRTSQRLEKHPTFSQKDDELFHEDGAIGDKRYQQFFHNSLQVSEDSCYQILQDNHEQSQFGEDKLEEQNNQHLMVMHGDEMKNYELSSIQQNTQNSLANFNPNDDVLLTSNREINNQGYQSDLNNLMQLNFNLLFPHSNMEEESQKSSVSKQNPYEYQFLQSSKNNTISDKESTEEKKNTLTAKELYLKAKEQNRVFLENLQKKSMRIDFNDLLQSDNPFKESQLLHHEQPHFEEIHNYQIPQLNEQTPELQMNDQNQPEKTCINTLLTECGDQGDLLFDLNELDQSLDNENFYDMIQQNINKVKEQTNFPHFNATFYPLDTIVLDKEQCRVGDEDIVLEEQNQSNTSSKVQQSENSTSWNSKNTSYNSRGINIQQNQQQLKKKKVPSQSKDQSNLHKKNGQILNQNAQQLISQNNAKSLINKYYNKKNRSTSQQCNSNQIIPLNTSQLQSRKNSTFNPLHNQDKENLEFKESFKQRQINDKENEVDLLILNEDPNIEILKVRAEQAPLKCISSNIINGNSKDQQVKQQITQFKNILGSKTNNISSTNVSALNSRKNSNVSSAATSQYKQDTRRQNNVGTSLNKSNNIQNVSKSNINLKQTLQNLNKIQKPKLDMNLLHQQENIQKNPSKQVTKNAAYEALQKIKNARSQVGTSKDDSKNLSQTRKRAQSIAGDSSKTQITIASSIDQRCESKLYTEATCSSTYIHTDQGSEFKKRNKRSMAQESQIYQSLEDLPTAKAKEASVDSQLRNSLNKVRNSLNECLNQKSFTNQNPIKISVYEDQYLMEAKKQEIEALQSLINSYEQEEQKFSSKLNDMNVNNIVIGDKKFLQQIRKSREERKQSTNNISPININLPGSSRNNSISLNQQFEATFSNQQSRQSNSLQPSDFNQVHRLSGSFTTKSSRNSTKSSQHNSFSIDSRAISNCNLSQPTNSQNQSQPWLSKKAPFYIKQQQQNQHQVSQDGVQNVAPSNTARSYLNKSQNDIENKSHLVSQCDISAPPNQTEQINGIIKDLIADKVYLQAVALFTSCYYYSKQGTQNQIPANPNVDQPNNISS